MFTVELVLYCFELQIISRLEPLPRSIQCFENSKAYLPLKQVVAFVFLDGRNTIRKADGEGITVSLEHVFEVILEDQEMTNSVNKWIRTVFDNLRKVFGDKCSFCGSKENLEFAHLETTELFGRGRGRKERYYDIKKNPDSYTLLCVVCHRTLDTVLKG